MEAIGERRIDLIPQPPLRIITANCDRAAVKDEDTLGVQSTNVGAPLAGTRELLRAQPRDGAGSACAGGHRRDKASDEGDRTRDHHQS